MVNSQSLIKFLIGTIGFIIVAVGFIIAGSFTLGFYERWFGFIVILIGCVLFVWSIQPQIRPSLPRKNK